MASMSEQSYLSKSAEADAVNSLGESMPDFVNASEIGRRFMEPENRFLDIELNRNNQMGNISKNDLPIMSQQWNIAKLIKSIPEDNGGFLFGWIGDHIVGNVHFFLTTSNSIDAKGRQSVISRVVRNISKDETDKGGFGSILNRKKE